MPNNAIAKTVLAPKRVLAVLIVICLVGGLSWLKLFSQESKSTCEGYRNDQKISVGRNYALELEIVKSLSEQTKGLSGRECIGKNQAMLFVFEVVGRQCMWMKDMRFDIDILWLNQQNQITKIEHSVSKNSYPKTYCSKNPDTRYVLELKSGTAKSLDLEVGQLISL